MVILITVFLHAGGGLKEDVMQNPSQEGECACVWREKKPAGGLRVAALKVSDFPFRERELRVRTVLSILPPVATSAPQLTEHWFNSSPELLCLLHLQSLP